MAGVWIFRDGLAKLVQNPLVESFDGIEVLNNLASIGKRKVLVYRPTNQIISSYFDLEQKLLILGWERYPNQNPDLLQFHKGYSSALLISLPKDFRRFKSMHMYDIVLKNRECFEVRDLFL